MKAALLFSTAAIATAASIPQAIVRNRPIGSTLGEFYSKSVRNIQNSRFQHEFAAESVPVSDNTTVKMIEELTPQYWPGSKRFKIRYGPFEIPAWNDKSATLAGTEEGGIFLNTLMQPKMPCADCLVTYAFFDLEDENGQIATDASGAWLHHALMISIGADKEDVQCHKPGYEIAFSGGNERAGKGQFVRADGSILPKSEYMKAGYYVKKADNYALNLELMNLANTPRKVYVTADWEYLEGKPSGFMNSKPLWQELGGCTDHPGADNPPEGQDVFILKSKLWTSAVSGNLSWVVGHLHDGGTHLELVHNEKVVCTSKAIYEKNSDGKGSSMAMETSGATMASQPIDHISTMTMCPNVAIVNPRDTMYVKAYYNFTLHPGMETVKGKPAAVMGIATGALLVPL